MPRKAQTTLSPEEEVKRKRAKQARARARRAEEKADFLRAQAERLDALKPLEEWDSEELARGRPRSPTGRFDGPKPTWLTRAVQEESLRRFQEISREDMRVIVPKALKTVENILESTEVDRRGRPLVPMSVKLQAAQWVVEHLVGKPTQRVEADISVKLQGILANCLVVPGQGTVPAIDVQSWDPDETPEDDDGED